MINIADNHLTYTFSCNTVAFRDAQEMPSQYLETLYKPTMLITVVIRQVIMLTCVCIYSTLTAKCTHGFILNLDFAPRVHYSLNKFSCINLWLHSIEWQYIETRRLYCSQLVLKLKGWSQEKVDLEHAEKNICYLSSLKLLFHGDFVTNLCTRTTIAHQCNWDSADDGAKLATVVCPWVLHEFGPHMACCLALRKKAKVVTEDHFEDLDVGRWLTVLISLRDIHRMHYTSTRIARYITVT